MITPLFHPQNFEKIQVYYLQGLAVTEHTWATLMGRAGAHTPEILLSLGLRAEAQGLAGSLLVNLRQKRWNLVHGKREREKKKVGQMAGY